MRRTIKTAIFLSGFLFFASDAFSQSFNEMLLSDTENAYNPIPSPDGTRIAYVRTGYWEKGSGGFGRSNLRSQVMVMDNNGHLLSNKPLADTFLSNWTTDGKNIVCYRDWQYYLITPGGNILLQGQIPETDPFYERTERVSFLSSLNRFVWVQNAGSKGIIQTPNKRIAEYNERLGELVIPSPNERYLAVTGGWDNLLLVYDTYKGTWANLGEIIIYPENDWDYIKPTWNPWFQDSTQLAFVTKTGLVISSADGKSRRIISNLNSNAGLATPSPDGKLVAYVTFETRAKAIRPDLNFFGNTVIWIISTTQGSTAYPITRKNEDTTYCLKWLNNSEILFDRIADEAFYRRARLWRVRALP